MLWAVQPLWVTHQQFLSYSLADVSQQLSAVGTGVGIPLPNALTEIFGLLPNRFPQLGPCSGAFCRRQEFFETLPLGGELFIFVLQLTHDNPQHVRGDATVELAGAGQVGY